MPKYVVGYDVELIDGKQSEYNNTRLAITTVLETFNYCHVLDSLYAIESSSSAAGILATEIATLVHLELFDKKSARYSMSVFEYNDLHHVRPKSGVQDCTDSL